MSKNLLLVTCLCAGLSVKAQDSLKTTYLDELVYVGSRMETSKEKSGKMIYQISGDDIVRSGARSLPDVLNQVPGIQMDGNFGAPGTNIDYFVRGAGSKRTLILIDGVPFNDPSGINLTYDLRLIDMNNIESIEVLRGGLSSLYGTGAAAAVIYIKTKQPKEDELGGSVSLETGSYGTAGASINVNGKLDKVTYGFSGRYRNSEGFSSAEDRAGVGFDKDGLTSENASLKLGYQFTDRLNLEISGSMDQFENEFDFGGFVDDVTSGSEYFQDRVGIRGGYSSERTQVTVSIFQNNLERRFNYGGFPDDYESQNNQSNIQMTQAIGEKLSFIAGVDLQKLEYQQPGQELVDFNSQAPYLSTNLDFDRLNVQVGIRMNNHSDYGSQGVYNFNPSYFFDLGSTTLKVLANYSTSYITPSLYQLSGPFGNPELDPELSESWDGGVSLYRDGLEVNAVYFQRIDTDPIEFFFDFVDFENSNYFNGMTELRVEGLELDFIKRFDKFNFQGNYTCLNNLWGSLRQRVPRIKYGLSGSYEYHENGSLTLNYNWTGFRKQTDPETFGTLSTSGFGLVSLTANQRFGRFTINGSVNNLLDEEYVAISGFTTMGRNYMLSVRMDLGK